MNVPRKKPHPTTRVAALIVIVVLLVIATLFYNAIKGKRDYDAHNRSASETVAPAAAVGLASSSAAASQ